jgi:hypothetical protein
MMLLPDGRVGAVWRGLVYPLNEAHEIDIVGEAFPPSACSSQGAASPSMRAFASIQGGDEVYFLLAGSAAARDQAAARLREAGLAVLRSGRYLGEPIEGLAADWFIRFVRPETGEPVDTLLARLLDLPQRHVASASESATELRLRLLHEELLQSRASEARLRVQLLDARNSIAATQTAVELPTLPEEPLEAREQPHDTEAPRSEAGPAVNPATAERPILRRPRIADELEAVLETLLPRIELLRDSLAVAAAEYDSRKSLYRALAELSEVEGRMPANWKAVKSAAGWWERHVSNGQDATGRVYAQQSASERRWYVLISDKGEQPRDMEWLRRRSKS